MELSDVGEVIAERRLTLEGDPASEVCVRIGKPVNFPDSTDYLAAYQITGIGSEKVKYAAGIDALQSLQLVLRMIGYDLKILNNSVNHGLRWEGDEHGFLGFE